MSSYLNYTQAKLMDIGKSQTTKGKCFMSIERSPINIQQSLIAYTIYLSNLAPTPKDHKDAIETLAAVFCDIVKYPSVDNMKAVWNFFVVHAEDVLQESVVVRNSSALPAGERMNFLLIYSIFKTAVAGNCMPDFEMLVGMVMPSPVFTQNLQQHMMSISA